MADEFKNEFDVDAKVVPGGNGAFDVIVDGEMVFSKYETGRFPEPGEVIDRIKGLKE